MCVLLSTCQSIRWWLTRTYKFDFFICTSGSRTLAPPPPDTKWKKRHRYSFTAVALLLHFHPTSVTDFSKRYQYFHLTPSSSATTERQQRKQHDSWTLPQRVPPLPGKPAIRGLSQTRLALSPYYQTPVHDSNRIGLLETLLRTCVLGINSCNRPQLSSTQITAL